MLFLRSSSHLFERTASISSHGIKSRNKIASPPHWPYPATVPVDVGLLEEMVEDEVLEAVLLEVVLVVVAVVVLLFVVVEAVLVVLGTTVDVGAGAVPEASP